MNHHKRKIKHLIRSRRSFRFASYTCILLLVLYVLCFIVPPVSTDNSHALTTTSIASDTTLSISLSGSVLPLDITPTSSSGTFASTASDSVEANTAVIHVTTNNITGYTLGIKASNPNSSSADKLISNNEQCENTPTSAKCAINSLSQAVSESQYIDNTVEGVDLNNTWGYAPSKYNSMPNTTTTTTLDPSTNENITITSPINYYPAPVSGDTIATTDSPNQENTTAGDGSLVADEYTIDYGMRTDYSTYAGTYSTNYNNQSYIITAVGNPVPYSVSYNANKPEQASSTSTVDNVPSAQTGTVSSGTTVAVVLSDKVPTISTTDPSTGDYTYAGYVFNGWCSVEPEVPTEIDGQPNTNGYQVCPVDQPQPGQEDPVLLLHPGDSIGIDQTADNTTTLYAVWGAPAKVTFSSNGLIFDNTTTTTTTTTNTINYIPTYEGNIITGQRRNRVYTGTYQTPIYEETTPTPTNYIMKGWSTDQQSTDPTYTDEQAIIDNLSLNADDNITLYASWTYTTVITFDGNGADSGIMKPFTIEAGKTEALPQNAFTKDGYEFTGWNTVATPTEQDPGEVYVDGADYQAGATSASVMLYAQWKIPFLYDKVQGLVKKDSIGIERTQTAADLKAIITKPTSNNPSMDTSNSGVYKYNTDAFGVASDASNDYAIYYYRGILDSNLDDTNSKSYGSTGNGVYYPNYVRLGDTCWRIVRTTGSGGTKMIYNGTYSKDTVANSCANALDNAQIASTGLSGSHTHKQAVRIGYTFNSIYAVNEAHTAKLNQVFGSNMDPSINDADSATKSYIENVWYEDLLELSAGYCNDRTVYDGTIAHNQLDEKTTDIITYGDGTLLFGPKIRTGIKNDARTVTLGCARDIVDLYTVDGAINGNKQLAHPAALLTADEVALAGSGGDGRGWSADTSSNYSYSSYLYSGNTFWLLSPNSRDPYGIMSGSVVSNHVGGGSLQYWEGVRPAISLKHEAIVTGGSGTAIDPWTINE